MNGPVFLGNDRATCSHVYPVTRGGQCQGCGEVMYYTDGNGTLLEPVMENVVSGRRRRTMKPRGYKLCKSCGQPLLKCGQVRKNPSDYRHASGCPEDRPERGWDSPAFLAAGTLLKST